MINSVCSNCVICEGIDEQTKPRILSSGNADSTILFIDGKNIDNEEMVESVLQKLFGNFRSQICYTNAVRCIVGEVKESFVNYCSLYTYFLLNKKKILFISALAKQQLEIEEAFEAGKMFVHKNTLVMFVDDVKDIYDNNLYDFYIPKIERLMENK